MSNISQSLSFILNITKLQLLLSRRFDGSLGGLGFNEFIILYHLSLAPDQKLRRIDLAGKVGLTASGITRLLLPMEKVGYIAREANPHDARVSYVLLASGGKKRLHDALSRAELLSQEIIPKADQDSLESIDKILTTITGTL